VDGYNNDFYTLFNFCFYKNFFQFFLGLSFSGGDGGDDDNNDNCFSVRTKKYIL